MKLFDYARTVLRALPSERRKVFQLLKLFCSVDRHTDRFRRRAQIHCKKGCGRCCENPRIEATVLEFLPAVVWLGLKRMLNETMTKLETQSPQGVCVFYKKDNHIEGNGRCLIYPFRPLVCRLFGFSIKKNKNGSPQLITCTVIKEAHSVSYQKAAGNTALLKEFSPSGEFYAHQLDNIDPHLGKELYPVNKAFMLAAGRIGLWKKLKGIIDQPGGSQQPSSQGA